MPAALVITSVHAGKSAQEMLRVQDTAAALMRSGWTVDVLTPRPNPILTAALPPDVRTFTLPKWVPPSRIGLFLVGVALASSRRYAVLHGIDEGADVARWVDRATVNHFAYVAEIRRGGVGKSTVRHASAVIASAEENLSLLKEPPPKGRVSVIPDPHAELVPDTFTFAEFSDALEGVYTYVRRLHPEIVQP
ncbi:MAG: glycosyltransferase [Kiritimatiellae bacterium]|nr:glycosyltransferase [Kiritimatiellia bacterium]